MSKSQCTRSHNISFYYSFHHFIFVTLSWKLFVIYVHIICHFVVVAIIATIMTATTLYPDNSKQLSFHPFIHSFFHSFRLLHFFYFASMMNAIIKWMHTVHTVHSDLIRLNKQMMRITQVHSIASLMEISSNAVCVGVNRSVRNFIGIKMTHSFMRGTIPAV